MFGVEYRCYEKSPPRLLIFGDSPATYSDMFRERKTAEKLYTKELHKYSRSNKKGPDVNAAYFSLRVVEVELDDPRSILSKWHRFVSTLLKGKVL